MTKVAIYGTGQWAHVHGQAWQRVEGAEVCGVAGYSNSDNLRIMADNFDIPVAALSWQDVLKETQPEVADIVVSPICRLEAVQAAVSTPSVTVINIEKPWALRPSDARKIRRLTIERGIRVIVNHQKKLLPAWRKTLELIESGALGRIDRLRATCGGTTAEQGTHIIDMVLEMMGRQPIDWIAGQVHGFAKLDQEHSAPSGSMCNIRFAEGREAYLAFGAMGFDMPRESLPYFDLGVEGVCEHGIFELSLTAGLWVKYLADGRIETDKAGWNDHFVAAQRDHLSSVCDAINHPAGWHSSDIRYAQDAFDVVMAIYASAMDTGAVFMPAEFSDRLVDEMMARRPFYGAPPKSALDEASLNDNVVNHAEAVQMGSKR